MCNPYLKEVENKFFEYFQIEHTSEIHDIILWKLMILGTQYPQFKPKNCVNKEDYIMEVLNGFMAIGESAKDKIKNIFDGDK